jgi:hypothetical protein
MTTNSSSKPSDAYACTYERHWKPHECYRYDLLEIEKSKQRLLTEDEKKQVLAHPPVAVPQTVIAFLDAEEQKYRITNEVQLLKALQRRLRANCVPIQRWLKQKQQVDSSSESPTQKQRRKRCLSEREDMKDDDQPAKRVKRQIDEEKGRSKYVGVKRLHAVLRILACEIADVDAREEVVKLGQWLKEEWKKELMRDARFKQERKRRQHHDVTKDQVVKRERSTTIDMKHQELHIRKEYQKASTMTDEQLVHAYEKLGAKLKTLESLRDQAEKAMQEHFESVKTWVSQQPQQKYMLQDGCLSLGQLQVKAKTETQSQEACARKQANMQRKRKRLTQGWLNARLLTYLSCQTRLDVRQSHGLLERIKTAFG